MALVDTLVTGGAIAVGLVVLVWLLRFGLAVSRGRDFGRAANMATVTIGSGVAATLGLVASGAIGFAEVLDVVTATIGGNPFVVSNLAGLGLGWLGLSEIIDLSPTAYVAGVGTFVVATLILSEVRG